MQTFDQALLRHHQAGRVTMEDALRVATSPHDFKLLVAAEGRTATSMDDLVDPNRVAGVAGPVTLKRPGPPAPAISNGSSAPPPGIQA
jgi:twitching motility protein PilT